MYSHLLFAFRFNLFLVFALQLTLSFHSPPPPPSTSGKVKGPRKRTSLNRKDPRKLSGCFFKNQTQLLRNRHSIMFALNSNIHNYHTCKRHHCHQPNLRSTSGLNSLTYNGIKKWNNLPNCIKTMQLSLISIQKTLYIQICC